MSFLSLHGTTIIQPKEVALIKTKSLIRAISAYKDTSLIRVEKKDGVGECLIIDIVLDQVPSKSPSGVKFRERLALIISIDESQIPKVFPLRHDFPQLAHTNDAGLGLPRDLCLYEMDVHSILRDWTAEKFLKRIDWWLGHASKDTLHFSDQPLEQAFYTAPINIILPNDFLEQNEKCENLELVILRAIKRTDNAGGGTSYFSDYRANAQRDGHSGLVNMATHVINLDPKVSKIIQFAPRTLQELYDLLKDDAPSELKRLKEYLTTNGTQEENIKSKSTNTLFLIIAHLKRDELSEKAEKTQVQAIFSDKSPGELGEIFGVLEECPDKTFPNRFTTVLFNDSLSESSKLKEVCLDQIEPIGLNSASDNRSQSNIEDLGPKGVMIGVGSLGSALIELWTRAGWGEWKIVDNDYIRPHNLVRHTACRNFIGLEKVFAVEELAKSIISDSLIESIVCDAISASDEVITSVFNGANFVIDASTTLDYPRRISLMDDAPRHCSVFLTPDGSTSVLLLEDEKRNARLIQIEAQYYRSLINDSWGLGILSSGPLGKYYSGTSCRDISMKMAYSTVLTHTANLAEHIQFAVNQPHSLGQVWKRDRITGAVNTHHFETTPVCTAEGMNPHVLIDQGLIDKMQQYRAEKLPGETGGILVGYHDNSINRIIVVDARKAPSDSEERSTSFKRGLEGVEEDMNHIAEATNDLVGYIGEWHSHPEGCSADPSEDDLIQIGGLAEKLDEDGLPAISIIISKNKDNSDNVKVLVAKIGE